MYPERASPPCPWPIAWAKEGIGTSAAYPARAQAAISRVQVRHFRGSRIRRHRLQDTLPSHTRDHRDDKVLSKGQKVLTAEIAEGAEEGKNQDFTTEGMEGTGEKQGKGF